MVTKEEKKRAINRLKTMYPIRAKIDEAYKRSAEAVKAGKPTVWSIVDHWAAALVFKAMDLEVLYPENYGAVIAASGLANKYLDICDADGFPTHLCGYARATLGYTSRMMREMKGELPPEAPMGGMPKPVLLLSHGGIREAHVKWLQAMGRYMDVPIWMQEGVTGGVEEIFAEGAYENAVKYLKEEFREFIAFLERLLGKKMDWDKYEEVVNDTIELFRIVYEALELRKAEPCPMHSRDFWSSMVAYLFLLGDLKESIKLYKDLYDEMKYRVDNKIGAVEPEKYRLVFADLPFWHSLGVFDKLAERGWNFVAESDTYHPPTPLEGIKDISDPLERHARFHLRFFTNHYKAAWEDKEYFGYHGYAYYVYARDYKCDGAIIHTLRTCRSASTHHPYLRDLLMRKAKIPSLTVEGDFVDQRLFDPEDFLRQAELFEETMEHYRAVRREEGFDW